MDKKSKVLFNLLLIIVVIVIFVLIPGMISIFTNNHAISLEQSVERSQGDIDAQLTRRAQLIPDLVSTVRHASEYERDTQLDIIEQRVSNDGDGSFQAGVAIAAVAEAYPDLKANENYQSLVLELSVTENLIFQYRTDYNEQVRSYSTFTKQWPWTWILGIMGYSIQDYEYTKDLNNGEYSKPGDLFG